jgi:hypothetical protein
VLFTGNAPELHDEMLDIAVGDVLASVPGNEIVGVDYTGAVYLLQRTAGAWSGATVHRVDQPLHAVVLGDFVPARPGHEILVAGASGRWTLLY